MITERLAFLGNYIAKLSLCAGVALGALAITPAEANRLAQLGTSFDCGRDTSPSAALVCNSEQVRRADLEQLQKYYILRHMVPAAQSHFRDQIVSRITALREECNAQLPEKVSVCVSGHLNTLRQNWIGTITASGNQEALEEAQLSVDQLLTVQTSLQQAGYLPSNARIDGVFGGGTRAAVSRFQSERGIQPSGFVSVATRRALQSVPTSSGTPPVAAAAPGAQNSAPHSNPYFLVGPRNHGEPLAIGTVASTEEICTILNHPIFQHGPALLRVISSPNMRIEWDSNNIARSWLSQYITPRLFSEFPRLWYPDNSTLALLANRMTECFNSIRQRSPDKLNLIFSFWGQPDNYSCPAGSAAICPRDFLASEVGEHWNRHQLFRIMLALREGHAALISSLDRLNIGVEERVQSVVALERRRQEDQRRRQEEQQAIAREQQERIQRNIREANDALRVYQARPKTLLEQVMNYTSFAQQDGVSVGATTIFWVSGHNGSHRCILTRMTAVNEQRASGSTADPFTAFATILGLTSGIGTGGEADRLVDIREFSDQGFRINSQRGRVSHVGDERRQIAASPEAVMDRLQNAWGLAFRECPGRRSAF